MRAGSNDYHADLIREQERMRGEERRGEGGGITTRAVNSQKDLSTAASHPHTYTHTHTWGSQPQNETASDQRTVADLFRKIEADRSCEITYIKTKFL